jgi:hypothetical protein
VVKKYPIEYYDEKIRNLYCSDGLTMRQVAETLAISVGKVYARLKFMNVPSRSQGDYEPTDKVRESGRRQGLRMKGVKRSEETKRKIAQNKTIKGIGGKNKAPNGYVRIYFPDHPKSGKDGYILEHDLIMECVLGRWLTDNEVVHHKNFVRDDNRLCNLQLMTKSSHMAYHRKLAKEKGDNNQE